MASGSYIGSLIYRITGDTSGVEKSLSDTKGKTESFASHIGGWATKVAALFGVAFTVDKIIEFDKKLLEVASHSNEVSSRFANTFPGAIAKANSAISELTDSYGYSSTAAKESMSATGGLLATLGMSEDQSLACSEQVAKLGADLASYTDFAGGAKGAADALTKAMLGETESSKSLSLSIGDDALSNYAASLGKSTTSMSTAEKAQLRLNLALEQAGAMGAVGDMIKTASGYANTLRSVQSKMEDAEARAGDRLIPNVTALTAEFGKAIEPGGVFAGAMDAIAEAGSRAAGALATLLAKLTQVSRESSVANNKEELLTLNTTLDVTKRRIESTYGSLEKARAVSEADSKAMAAIKYYDDAINRVKALTDENDKLNKSLAADDRSNQIKNIRTLQAAAQERYTSALEGINAVRRADEKYLSLEEAADNAEGQNKANAVQALREYNGLLDKSFEIQSKIGAKVGEIYQSSATDAPQTKIHTVAAPTGGKQDDATKKAAELRAVLLKMDDSTRQLTEDTASLSKEGIASVGTELDKAVPAVKDFITAFNSFTPSALEEFYSDLKTKDVPAIMAKWKDDFTKAGEAYSALTKNKELEIKIKPIVEKAKDASPYGDISFENLFPSDTDWQKNTEKVQKFRSAWNELSSAAGQAGESLNGILSGASSAVSAYYSAKLAGLDAAMKAEEEAAGVSDETATQKAQKEYDAAEKSGNKTLIAEKKKALTKAKIEEDYAKKKADLEYKGALMAWNFQVAQGAIAVPLAILNTYAAMSTLPVPIPAIAAAAAGVSAGLMEGAIIEAQPKRANFAIGGVVPGSSYSGDKIPINANSGERVLTAEQNKYFEALVEGKTGSGSQVIHNHVYLGTEEIYSEMFNASADGRLVIHKNGVSAR